MSATSGQVQVRPLSSAEQLAFAAARFAAGRRQPYLSAALFALSAWAAEGLGTFGVDRRWCVYLDPDRLLGWSAEECAGVLLHEVGHLVRDHARRGEVLGTADPDRRFRWNVAGDLAINDDLQADGIVLPGSPVTPAALGLPAGRLEEEYFAILQERAEAGELRRHAPPRPALVPARPGTRGSEARGSEAQTGRAQTGAAGAGTGDCGSAGDGHVRPWEAPGEDAPTGLTDSEATAVRLRVAQAVRDAGTAPLGWQRWADAAEPGRSDWRCTLRAAISRPRAWHAGNQEATWHRPHRRSDTRSDLLRPGTRSPAFEIAVVLDTSGSMADSEIAAALAEIDAIQRQCGVRHLWFVACDSRPRPPRRVRRVEPGLVRGGGGTDLREALQLLPELRPRPDVAVVLTDGWTPWPDRRPRGMSLVVATTDLPCPIPGTTTVEIEAVPAPSGPSRPSVATTMPAHRR